MPVLFTRSEKAVPSPSCSSSELNGSSASAAGPGAAKEAVACRAGGRGLLASGLGAGRAEGSAAAAAAALLAAMGSSGEGATGGAASEVGPAAGSWQRPQVAAQKLRLVVAGELQLPAARSCAQVLPPAGGGGAAACGGVALLALVDTSCAPLHPLVNPVHAEPAVVHVLHTGSVPGGCTSVQPCAARSPPMLLISTCGGATGGWRS